MDDNVKDVLLVLMGGLISFISTITLHALQTRRDRRLFKLDRNQRHYDDAKEYLYAHARFYELLIEYYGELRTSSRSISGPKFNDEISDIYDQAMLEQFSMLPTVAISRDPKLQIKIAEIKEITERARREKLPQETDALLTDEGVEKERKNLERMNQLINEVLDKLEKGID